MTCYPDNTPILTSLFFSISLGTGAFSYPSFSETIETGPNPSPRFSIQAPSLQDLQETRAPSAPTMYEQSLSLSFSEQAAQVQEILSLNRSQLAEVLRISRPTLYAWIDGAAPNTQKCHRLLSLLRLISKAGVALPFHLHSRFVRHPLTEDGASLLDLAKQDALPEEALLQTIIRAKEMTTQYLAQTRQREKQFRELGYEDVSHDEQKANLSLTHSLMELDS